MPIEASIIIVSFNNEDSIEKCVTSLLKFQTKNSEIIVVDNASEDKTLEILKSFKDKIKLIISDKNLGYSKGNNLAVKESLGEYLFFLNPDTYIEESIINNLIIFYEAEKNIGIVAPKLVMPNGKTQASVKKLPTIWRAIKEYILGIKYSYSEYVPNTNVPIEVEAIYGAAFLIKRNLFSKIGGFDEKYFLYYEDIDICRKVLKSGKKIYYNPDVVVYHTVGGSKTDFDKYTLNYKSSFTYHGLLKGLILQGIFRIYGLIQKISK